MQSKTESSCVSLRNTLASFLILISLLAAVIVPVNAQSRRGGRGLGSISGRSAASFASRTTIATRLSKVSMRGVAPVFSRAANPNLVHATMTRVNSTFSAVRGIRGGSISVSVGSLGRRKITPVVNTPVLKNASIATGKTSSSLKTARAQNLQQSSELKRLPTESLSPRARREVGSAINSAEKEAAATQTRATKAQALELNATSRKTQQATKPLHKNSKNYRGPTHVYVIVGPDGRLHKIGESATGLRLRDGKSRRAESQVRRFNRENGDTKDGYRSRVLKTFASKEEARAFERQLIAAYRKKHGPRALKGERVLGGNRSYH